MNLLPLGDLFKRHLHQHYSQYIYNKMALEHTRGILELKARLSRKKKNGLYVNNQIRVLMKVI